MKSKELFGLVISFVMAITFCCSEMQVAAVGSPAADGKAAVSKAVALVSAAGFGTLASLWHQQNKEIRALRGGGGGGDGEALPRSNSQTATV
ncbi:MAG: hypothetical protein LBJ38_02880, partial [Oscillospiraceae bacterium]|nr:hypothetical protein [Oscillospiraceae bacterium]